MSHTPLKPFIPPYPAPVSLVGAMVEGRPNFLAVAWLSAVSYQPPMLMVSLNHVHHTNKGIHTSGEFSLCLPSADMVKVTDFCGLNSGSKINKANLFDVVYGTLKNAPLIAECPMSIEMRLVDTQRYGANEVFVGEIVQVHVRNECIVDGKPSLARMKPLFLDSAEAGYRVMGDIVEKAWSCGREYTPEF